MFCTDPHPLVICKPYPNWLETNTVLHLVYVSESMEAFAKKKGKVGTRGGGQIIKENDETLVFYRFALLTKYIGPSESLDFKLQIFQEHDTRREWPVLFDHGCYGQKLCSL